MFRSPDSIYGQETRCYSDTYSWFEYELTQKASGQIVREQCFVLVMLSANGENNLDGKHAFVNF